MRTINRFFSLLSIALSAGFALPQVSAQTVVSWGTPQAVTVASNVLNTGTAFAAYTAAGTTVVTNGVTFSGNATQTNLTVSFEANIPDFGSFSSGDTGFNRLIGSGAYTSPNGTSTIVLSNLVTGHTYRVQLFTPVWDNTYRTQFTAGSNTVDMGNTNSAPTYVTGTFVAASSDLTISYRSTTNEYGLLSAVSVFTTAIPEPSTYAAIAGLLGLGFAVWSRRRARA